MDRKVQGVLLKLILMGTKCLPDLILIRFDIHFQLKMFPFFFKEKERFLTYKAWVAWLCLGRKSHVWLRIRELGRQSPDTDRTKKFAIVKG